MIYHSLYIVLAIPGQTEGYLFRYYESVSPVRRLALLFVCRCGEQLLTWNLQRLNVYIRSRYLGHVVFGNTSCRRLLVCCKLKSYCMKRLFFNIPLCSSHPYPVAFIYSCNPSLPLRLFSGNNWKRFMVFLEQLCCKSSLQFIKYFCVIHDFA